MKEFPEAKVALCKCKESKMPYGVRFERNRNGWQGTWAFVIKNEGTAKREGYGNTVLKGSISTSEEYPGCPYCGGRVFTVCGGCSKLNCYTGKKELTCNWCGYKGQIVKYGGTGIQAGNDL